MSIIKSFSVGNGDMFYIRHDSDSFTIIDCCLNGELGDHILADIAEAKKGKGISRFISTHPDEDHLRGLERLNDEIGIVNFYCVKNSVAKDEITKGFAKYCELRDSSIAYPLSKNCSRKWMTTGDDERGTAGISILWPDLDNVEFKTALANAEDGTASPNNISPIIQYKVGDTVFLWMGDLETDFLEAVEAGLDLPKVTVLFAPHHGRFSGRVPKSLLEKMSPDIIVIGEAPSEHLHYYDGYNTITQNSTGDIVFDCDGKEIHVFTCNEYECNFLTQNAKELHGHYYVGTHGLKKYEPA